MKTLLVTALLGALLLAGCTSDDSESTADDRAEGDAGDQSVRGRITVSENETGNETANRTANETGNVTTGAESGSS